MVRRGQEVAWTCVVLLVSVPCCLRVRGMMLRVPASRDWCLSNHSATSITNYKQKDTFGCVKKKRKKISTTEFTIIKVKRKVPDWEKLLTACVTDKEVGYKTYEELLYTYTPVRKTMMGKN